MFNIENIDVIWMRYAVVLADYAEFLGEVSVGAVLVYNGSIVGYGWNSSIMCNDPTAHAEILALRMGGRILGNYRLLKTTLYVTLEPCMMCVGAMIHARICRLVCGAINNKVSLRTEWNVNMLKYMFNKHNIVFTFGVLETVCSKKLINFFVRKRKNFCRRILHKI